MRRKKNQVTSSDSNSNDSSSDTTPPPKKKQGRPAVAKNKKQRLQDDSDDDVTAQPSTSQNRNNINSASEESESDSTSESLDSDYEHIIDRNTEKKKNIQKKKGKVLKTLVKQKKPHQNDANSSRASQKHDLNSTIKKNIRASVSNTSVLFDSKAVEALAQKCVYFLLIEDQKKYAIKRKAIVTHVFKDETYSTKLYIAVIKKANMILKKTYGMELMELENQKDSYLIVNILNRELGIHDYVELSRLKQQQHGLILYLVTVIYMNDNVITEEELTKALKPLGIDLTSKRMHPVFGDVKKYITSELVKQMYLNYECVSKEPPNYEITWGLRAKQEFGKMDLLRFACQIMDDTSPEDWKIQYKDAENCAKSSSD